MLRACSRLSAPGACLSSLPLRAAVHGGRTIQRAAALTRWTLVPPCCVSRHACCAFMNTSVAATSPVAPASSNHSASAAAASAPAAPAAATSAAPPASSPPPPRQTFDPSSLRGLLRELYDRGMIADMTHPDALMQWLEGSGADASSASAGARPTRVIYAGFDPTAPSLHLGNLLVLMVLRRFQSRGHEVVCIVGGATGMIGDPSGRSSERNIMGEHQLQRNIEGITADIRKFIRFDAEHTQASADASSSSSSTAASSPAPPRSLLLNNASWYSPLHLIPFLRDVGRHFRMGSMLSKESVSARMASAQGGMSFTEFTYQVLQAYDFSYLNRNYNVSVQIGGSDQWGNITAGIDLIQREASMQQQQSAASSAATSASSSVSASAAAPSVFGLTLPLLTTSDGQKFGKSAGNAPIWLAAPSESCAAAGSSSSTAAAASSYTTSPYALYQYFLTRTSDADVGKFLRLFTDHSLDQIAQWEKEHRSNPQALCRILAESVTRMVHGDAGLKAAQDSTAALFGSKSKGGDSSASDLSSLSAADFDEVFAGVPRISLPASELIGRSVVVLAVTCKACSTKAEARRLIASGGLYLNNVRVTTDSRQIEESDLLGAQKVCVLRSGKKKQFVIRCTQEG